MSNIVKQARRRAGHLPEGTHQAVIIETLGFDVASEELEALRMSIVHNSNGLIAFDDIHFLGRD